MYSVAAWSVSPLHPLITFMALLAKLRHRVSFSGESHLGTIMALECSERAGKAVAVAGTEAIFLRG